MGIEFKHQKANVPKTYFIPVNNQMKLDEPKEFSYIYMIIAYNLLLKTYLDNPCANSNLTRLACYTNTDTETNNLL